MKSSRLATRPPSVAVEIAARRVTAVSMADTGGTHVISAHATEPLPAGAVDPSLNASNVHDQGALVAALKSVLERAAGRTRRIALVLPDTVAKVSLIHFEKVPPKQADLEQLIRWQVRKTAPFRIEDAQIGWVPGAPHTAGGREFVVTLARRDIIESYERACDAAGAYAGIVDLASPNVINTAIATDGTATGDPSAGSGSPRATSRGDWLLVHVTADYATLAVVRGEQLLSFRNRATSDDADLADLVHQTAMYHEDRLGGGGFTRVVLAGMSSRGAEEADRLRRSLEERIATRLEPIDFRSAAALRDRITASPELLDILAPAVGVLLRERVGGAGRAEQVA